MAKIKVDSNLLGRAKSAAKTAGYSSIEEFITYIIEQEVAKMESANSDDHVADQLRGLGYIE